MADLGEKFLKNNKQVFYSADTRIDKGIELSNYTVDGNILTALKYIDPWNDLADTENYKNFDTPINTVAQPGTLPKFYDSLTGWIENTDTATDKGVTLTRTDSAITITVDGLPKMTWQNTDFRNNICPKKVIVELQAAGGGGGHGGDGWTASGGGGAGAYWCGVVPFDADNNKINIWLGHPGPSTADTESKKLANDSTIFLDSDEAVIVEAGYNPKRVGAGNASGGAGGKSAEVKDSRVYTLGTMPGGDGGRSTFSQNVAVTGLDGGNTSDKTIYASAEDYGYYTKRGLTGMSGGEGCFGHIIFAVVVSYYNGPGGGGASALANGGDARKDQDTTQPGKGAGAGGGGSLAGVSWAVGPGGPSAVKIWY